MTATSTSRSLNEPKVISFTVAEGETICLLGASGSGKSTILRMIAGLEFPERGAILLNNLDLAQTPPHLRDFGLVFQDYGLFPHLNVFDNIAFGLKMRNIPAEEIKQRVAELIEQINLSGVSISTNNDSNYEYFKNKIWKKK